MSADAIICLEAAEPATIELLLPRLAGRLNRGSEPRVAMTAADDGIWFRSPTWQPILVARVEDALDELVGSSWPGRYVWA